MYCVSCRKDVEAETVSGADVYGTRFAFALSPYSRCPQCGNYGESAEKGEPPYLAIPDFRLRRAYNYIDGVLDLLWMQKKMTKAEVLYRMADLMYNQKQAYRTHDISDYEEACRAYRLAKKLKEDCFNEAICEVA